MQEFTIGEIKSVDSNDAPSRVTLCIPAVFKADSGEFSRRTEDLKLELGAEDIEDVEGDIEEIEGKFCRCLHRIAPSTSGIGIPVLQAIDKLGASDCVALRSVFGSCPHTRV